MNPRHFDRKPEGPFMLLGASEIEQFKRLEAVFARALVLVQDPRFERELMAPGNFRDLGRAVRALLESEQDGM